MSLANCLKKAGKNFTEREKIALRVAATKIVGADRNAAEIAAVEAALAEAQAELKEVSDAIFEELPSLAERFARPISEAQSEIAPKEIGNRSSATTTPQKSISGEETLQNVGTSAQVPTVRNARPALALAQQTEADLRAKEAQAEMGRVEEQTAAVRDRNEAVLTPPEGTAPPAALEPQPTQQQGLFGAVAALRQAADAIEKVASPVIEKTAEKSIKTAEQGGANRIQDVGENLWYNRRNFTRGATTWDDVKNLNDTLKVKEVVKSKVWPKPNYEQLVEQGMEPFFARMLKHVYDGIATAPTGKADAELQRYIAVVGRVREAVFDWAKDNNANRSFLDAVAAKAKQRMERRFVIDTMDIRDVLLDRLWPAQEGRRGLSEEARGDLRAIGGNRAYRALQFTLDDAVDAMKDLEKGWPKSQEAWQRQGYSIAPSSATTISDVGAREKQEFVLLTRDGWNGHQISRHQTREDVKAAQAALKPFLLLDKRGRLMSQHDTEEQAKEAARELVKREGGGGDVRGMNISQAERTGEALRKEGENATPERLMQEFGFRGVNFGREGWINQNERQAYLNHAYDGLHDLAGIMDVPPKALSLNGMLGIAFGAQGRGGHAAAHFVPGVNEINLTKTMGAGTLAHEWGHALDHYFATQAGLAKTTAPFMSEHATLGETKAKLDSYGRKVGTEARFGEIRPEIAAAFKAVTEAMEKRPITEAEFKARETMRKNRSIEQLERWIQHFRKDIERTKIGDEALTLFDQAAERLRKGDRGEYVKVRGQTLSQYVGAIKLIVRDHTQNSSVDLADNYKGLEANASHVAYVLAQKDATAAHEPQTTNTAYAGESSAKDRAKGGKAYWRTRWEMFARAFETYVADRLAAAKQTNTFLSDAALRAEAKDREGGYAMPYPRGDDRERINGAIDKLVNEIKTKETDKGVAMFSRAEDANGQPLIALGDIRLVGPQAIPDRAIGSVTSVGSSAFQHNISIGDRKLGEVILAWKDGNVTELLYIKTARNLRGQGIAERVVSGILQHNDGQPLRAVMVLPEARGFWEKMGAEFVATEDGEDGILTQESYAEARSYREDQTRERQEAGERGQQTAEREGAAGRGDARSRGGRQALTSRGPQSGQGTQGVFATDEANRKATDALQSNLRRQGHQFTITPVSLPVDRSADAEGRGDNAGAGPSDSFGLAERLAGVFGKRVVWMRADGPARINGVVIAGKDLAKEIFIDVRAGVPAHAIVGHELSHHMERDAPEAYAKLRRAIDGLLRNHAEYRSKLGIGPEFSDDYVSKEIIGDLLGDNFTKREFWSRVAKESGGTFRQIANTIKTWLDNLIGRLRGFGSDRFVTDVHAARKALAQAVVEYAKGRNEAVLPEWVRMSRAAVEGDGLAPSRDQTASAAFKANNEGISFGHYSPSEQQVATLRAIEPRVQKGFQAYLADLLDNNEAEIAEAMADKSLRLDYLNEYLDRELSISVRDDGRITIDYLPTSEVRRAVGDLPIVVFHHTASGALKHIKKEGLRPQKKRGGGTNYSSGAGVYVTLRQSGVDVEGYGRNAVRRYGGEPVAVEIEARLRDLEQDPDDADIQSGAYQYILPDVKPSEIINSSAAKNPSSSAPLFSLSEQAMGAVQGGRETTGNRASWDAPEPGKLDTFIRVLQDKQIDTKRVVQAIKNAAGVLKDSVDVYLQEELFHGRVAKAVHDFLDNEYRPLLTEMAARHITMADLEEYLHARHAEERNAQIAKVNPEMPDGGSGITNAEAQDYLSKLDPVKLRAYESLAKRVDAIIAKTREELIAYGLESPSTIRAWESAYENYVPLQREDMEGGMGIGQGFSVRGPASRRATGSRRKVVDILANVAMQRERALVRGEKNRVANALIGLAKENPNLDFWSVDRPPKLKVVNERTGLVEERVDPLYKSRENVVVARIPGADGNVSEHAVVFNEHDERAIRMAAALKNLDAHDLGEVLSLSAKMTRYFASINTQYNPVFGVVNLTRDTQGALFNLSSTPLVGRQMDVLRHTLDALRGIYIDARAVRRGEHPSSAWAQEFEEFQKEGGQTGYRDMFRTSKDRAEAIEREIARVSEGKAKHFGRAVFDWLSDYNNAMENAVRLAAYKVAKENGLSKQRAASLAKNLTVNFNRKGSYGTQIGALYAFFNASVQGTARLAETLRGPAGKKIITGGLLLGSMQALLLAAAGFDDDEPPEFVRERSLVLPIGGKKYITIPMPLGLHVLPNLGRIPTEFVLDGFRNPQKRFAQLANVFTDAFNPIGNAGLSLQTIAPTIIDPVAALAENKDWTGKPIAREDFNKLAPTPGHTRAKDTATEFSKAVSKALNWLSGGTNYKAGIFSPTPDQIDYLIGQATGGLGREALKVEQMVTSTITGEELPTYKIPLLGRFYGSSEGQSPQANTFYANLKEINEHEAEVKGRLKAHEPVAEYIAENPEARLIRYANQVERQVSALRRQRRMLIEQGAERSRIKSLDERITNLMRQFNERVRITRDRAAA